jgi:hypothetical protein
MVACYKTEYTLSFCQELVGGPINSGTNELIVHTLHPLDPGLLPSELEYSSRIGIGIATNSQAMKHA